LGKRDIGCHPQSRRSSLRCAARQLLGTTIDYQRQFKALAGRPAPEAIGERVVRSTAYLVKYQSYGFTRPRAFAA
jgi:hypothetical protein